MNQVLLIYAADGAELTTQIREALKPGGWTIEDNPSKLPEHWEPVAILFVLTPKALEDPNCIQYANEANKADLPLIPVVEDISRFSFSELPSSLSMLEERNAVGIKTTFGRSLLETVRGYLGEESFARDKRIFISYRRSDGKEVAQKLHDYLWSQQFIPFLDTEQIEGGARVQGRILHEIREKDFVLIVDSPDAATSEWVRKEITEARVCRIPVCAVCLDRERIHLPELQDTKRLVWDETNPHNLQLIKMMVSRSLARRRSLDDRFRRTLQNTARLNPFIIEELETRRFFLKKNGQNILLDYEDAPVSLERLHRLYIGYREKGVFNHALFVCGDYVIAQSTHEAVMWARGNLPLEVLPLSELYSTLSALFATL